MIELVDEALRAWLGTIDPSAPVDLERRLPTGDDAAADAARLVLVLARVGEQIAKRDNRVADVRGDDGAVLARQRPTRWFELDYWCAATGPAADAHRLLGALVQRLVDHDVIPRQFLPGPLAELGLPVDAGLIAPSSTSATVGLRVVLPVQPTPDREISAPATVLHLDVSPPPGAPSAAPTDGEPNEPVAPPPLHERTWTTVRRRERIGPHDRSGAQR